MHIKEKNGVVWQEFKHIGETGLVRHCFSTRKGGLSKGCFESMNLGLSRGDDRKTVLKNYELLCEAIGFEVKNLVFSNQVHKTDIYHVVAEDVGRSWSDANHICGIDGLATTVPNAVLVTFYADCVPLMFLDPVEKIIAVSHAGWRGTVDGMAKKTVLRLCELGARPENILAGIGPSISKCCFEVDAPVVAEFLEKWPQSAECIEAAQNGKSRIDLKAVNLQMLMSAGVLEKNIEVSDDCTKCNSDLYYSHRGMGDKRGSLAAFIALNERNEK